MKVYRFMSTEEFAKYLAREKLKNNTKHLAITNSVGFCFFDYDDENMKPEIMIHSLTGIVSLDVLAVFETDRKNLKESYGVYATPMTVDSWEKLINRGSVKLTEYCTKSYSKDTFKLVKVAKPKAFDYSFEEFKYYTEEELDNNIKKYERGIKNGRR